jgi:DNA-binding HxlR family transcriptional regulator
MDDALRLPTCSIGRAMEILGERWTLLILRECFYGVKRFSVMQRNLGIARNILSSRLQLLVRTGILERRCYQHEPQRFEYKLTEKASACIRRWSRSCAGATSTCARTARRSSCVTAAATSPTPCWSARTAAPSSIRTRSRQSLRPSPHWPGARFSSGTEPGGE